MGRMVAKATPVFTSVVGVVALLVSTPSEVANLPLIAEVVATVVVKVLVVPATAPALTRLIVSGTCISVSDI